MLHRSATIERNWRECGTGQEHVCKYYTTQQLSMMNATTVNALPTTGQELTARGAPKLVVTVNITESVEKRLSLKLEHRIWSMGDTGGGA